MLVDLGNSHIAIMKIPASVGLLPQIVTGLTSLGTLRTQRLFAAA
ncbi:hypothetical protein [Mesorhizobium sp. M0830]